MIWRELDVWIKVKVPVTKMELEAYAGDECPERVPSCATCKSYAMWKREGCIEVLVERKEFMQWVLRKDS